MSNIRKFNLSKSQYVEIMSLQKQGMSVKAIANKFNFKYQALINYLKNVDENNLVDSKDIKNQLSNIQLIEKLEKVNKENDELKSKIESLTTQLKEANDKIKSLNAKNKELAIDKSKIDEIEFKVENQEINNDIKKLISDMKIERTLKENPFDNEVDNSRLQSFNDGLMEYESGKLFFDKNLMLVMNPHNGKLLKYNASIELMNVVNNKFNSEYNKALNKVEDMLPYINNDWDAMEIFNLTCRNLFEVYKNDEDFNTLIDELSL